MVLQAKSSIIVLFLLCVLSSACNKRKSSLDTIALDVKALPMMHSEHVSSLVSDSGITRYRMNAEIWEVYSDNVPEPYWYFPKGIYIEKFDSVFNVEGSIIADTAYNYEKRGLWKVIGNVKAKNLQGEKFETTELFWDKKSETIYTDKFIRVERKDRVFMGVGFHSNQEMTRWRIFDLQGEIVVNDADSDSTDTKSPDIPAPSQ